MSRFRGISARISQWIVRAAPVGYEEFYVLLERGLFNPAPVEHTHIFDGTERWVWPPVSTGRLNRDTPGGTFNAIWTDADHVSREWDKHPCPILYSSPKAGTQFMAH
jgi:hypothetical protein